MSTNGNGHGGDRDERGFFLPGHTVTKGNTRKHRMHELRKELHESVTPEQVRKVAARLYDLAVDGDVAAARLWLEHTVGKPTQAIEVSGPDGSSVDLSSVVTTIMMALGDDVAARVRIAQAFRARGIADGSELDRSGESD